ncbi:hypothetical protein PG987_015651 [Apiospora arundinis]
MSGHASAQVLLQLTNTLSNVSKVAIETSYGLVVVVNTDKSVAVHQTTSEQSGSDGVSSQWPGSEPDPQYKRPGYKYRVFPDYETGFVWYDSDWPGNPEGSFGVDENELEERYGEAWNKTYNGWMDRYTAAFEKQKCQLDSGEHPFPDTGERKAWVVEGLLLCCWLALQPDVENVEYGPDVERVDLNKDSVGAALQSTLGELDKFLT